MKPAWQAYVGIVSLNDKACNAVRSESVKPALPAKMHGKTFTPPSGTWFLLEQWGSNHRGTFLSQSLSLPPSHSSSLGGGGCKISSCFIDFKLFSSWFRVSFCSTGGTNLHHLSDDVKFTLGEFLLWGSSAATGQCFIHDILWYTVAWH